MLNTVTRLIYSYDITFMYSSRIHEPRLLHINIFLYTYT